MKRRVHKIANFFAFNLLFFALYLNFVHKDQTAVSGSAQINATTTAAFSGTVLVDNPDEYLKAKAVNEVVSVANNKEAAAKLSIN